mmetsp:Transcript_6128/g.24832  ORF Transcript_6128/g.24832 Transcript_6128/m.24832 type:complete len:310 (+) Transcript_6128:44-973(+)
MFRRPTTRRDVPHNKPSTLAHETNDYSPPRLAPELGELPHELRARHELGGAVHHRNRSGSRSARVTVVRAAPRGFPERDALAVLGIVPPPRDEHDGLAEGRRGRRARRRRGRQALALRGRRLRVKVRERVNLRDAALVRRERLGGARHGASAVTAQQTLHALRDGVDGLTVELVRPIEQVAAAGVVVGHRTMMMIRNARRAAAEAGVQSRRALKKVERGGVCAARAQSALDRLRVGRIGLGVLGVGSVARPLPRRRRRAHDGEPKLVLRRPAAGGVEQTHHRRAVGFTRQQVLLHDVVLVQPPLLDLTE